MGDLEQINDIVNSAVQDSSYITVLISSGVFILYTLITKLIELYKAKNRNKPIVEMASAISNISENVVKLNMILDKTLKEAETKNVNKTKNIIEITFNAFGGNIKRFCEDVVIHNNIAVNEESIKQSIYKHVSTEYYKLYSSLSLYEIDDVNVGSKIKQEWIDELVKECLTIIYNGQDSINRITQLGNKLKISMNEYSVYVMNKIFNR